MLRIANYGAMILEPLLPLMLILPAKNRLKWALFAGCAGFHLGIIATMMIPYANVACLAAGPIIFRHEIMSWLGVSIENRSTAPARLCWRTQSALAFVAVLTLAMAGEVRIPSWRFASRERAVTGDGRVGFMKTEHNIFYTPLWFVGIAQSYRLFDWIDDRNFHSRYEITEANGSGAPRNIETTELFPNTLRSVLLQAYLHDVTWGRVPRNRAGEFKAGLSARFANRFCRTHPATGVIQVRSQLERIKIHGAVVRENPEVLLKFECQHSEASVQFPRVDSTRALADVR